MAACDVFLAVIGPNWLDAKDDDGRRRFDNPDDFVTIEIAAALARNIRVIPVLVDGARTPKADKLPDLIKPLVRRNAVEVRNTNFGRDAEALTNKVREALKDAPTVPRRLSFMASAAAQLMPPGRWRTVAGSTTGLLLAGWIGLYQMGVTVWVPWTPRAEQPHPPRADEAKAVADAEAQRKDAEAEQQRQAKAAADANAKLKAAEAEQQRLKEEEQGQAKAEADANAKLKAAEAEQQRLAAIKEEEQRQAKTADVEAKLKVAIAEQERLKEEVQRQAKAAADAEAQRKAAIAEQQQLKEEVQRQAKVAADAEAKRKAAEAEQQRLVAVKAEEERKAKAEAEAAAKRKAEEAERQRLAAPQPSAERAPAASPGAPNPNIKSAVAPINRSTYWVVRNGMEASGVPAAEALFARSIAHCEQTCEQSNTCKVFTYKKSDGSCYTYTQASLLPNTQYDSGIQQSVGFADKFTRRNGMEASGAPAGEALFARSIAHCEQTCEQSNTCKVFTYKKSDGSCYTYTQASLLPNTQYDSGIRN